MPVSLNRFKAVGKFDAPPAQLYKYISFFPGDSDQLKKKIHKIVEVRACVCVSARCQGCISVY